MSDGSLSQDEIDALLQETESLEIDTGFGGSEPLSEDEKGHLVTLLEGVIDSQASNLSILTRKNVNLERPSLDLVMGEEILDQLPDEVVDVKIDFTDALAGEHSYLVDSTTAQAVAGLMMGQTGVELDDAALSAVAEALSQISGPVATEIGNQSGKTVQNAPPDFQSVSKDKVRLPQGEVVVKLEYPLMIEGENPAKLIELYSLSLAKEIITDIVERCDYQPLYIQQFLFDLWRSATVSLDILDDFEKAIIASHKNQFIVLWDLLTLNQKKALRLLAETGGESIYTAEQLQRVGFNSGSVLQRALKSLIEKEILSRNGTFQFQDVMLKKWVQSLS